MPPPTPIRPVIGTVIIGRWRRVIDRLVHLHIAVIGSVLRAGAARIGRRPRGSLARNATAHIERGLDRKAALVLPGDLAPAFAAFLGIDQAAAGNFGDDLALRARRSAQVHGRSDVRRLGPVSYTH